MRLALALKAVEVVEESSVYSSLDELLWCGKSETPISSVIGRQEEEVTADFNLLRSRLESERKHLIEELEQLEASIRQACEQREGDPVGKWGEGAMESSELDKCLALEKQTIDRLTEVEHALHKFDSGTYGLCDNCGQPVDPARLEALPQASLCLSCKAHQAKNAKVRSSPG